MKKVTVVGVGALGSHLVQFLRSEDVEFKLIDFDRVEQKNTMSQFHGKPGVGKLKVQAFSQVVQFLWGMKPELVTNKLTDKNVSELLTGAHLVIDCLDNAEARTYIQQWVRAFPVADRMPLLHGAVDGEGSFGRVVWDEDFIIDSGSAPGTPTCEDGENLPFIASVSAYIARSAQAFLRKGVKQGYQVSPGGVVITLT
jgi:molybdopterin-synthase adenylyltransferase